MSVIFEGAVVTTQNVDNFPEGREVQIHTDADLTVAFYFPKTNSWGGEISVEAPGQWVGAGSYLGRITGTANVRILNTVH